MAIIPTLTDLLARGPATTSFAMPGFDRRAIPAHARESMWTAPDGWPIRRIDWPVPDAPKGSLLLLTGRGDFYEKYLELLEQFYRAGWRVAAFDWRGQGGSGRLTEDQMTGHVEDFGVWVDDLAHFFAGWEQEAPGPHVLLAHSMGGHIVTRALVEERIRPDALILSAPMMGLKAGGLPPWLGRLIARGIAATGMATRRAWKHSEAPFQTSRMRQTLLTHDSARYEDETWWLQARPELQLGSASWRWICAAYESIADLERPGLLERLHLPVLTVATRADQLVDPWRIEQAVDRMPDSELIMLGEEAAHEVLREEDRVRDGVLEEIFGFLERRVNGHA